MPEEIYNRLLKALEQVNEIAPKIEFNSRVLEDIRKDLDRLIDSRGQDTVAIAKLELGKGAGEGIGGELENSEVCHVRPPLG